MPALVLIYYIIIENRAIIVKLKHIINLIKEDVM